MFLKLISSGIVHIGLNLASTSIAEFQREPVPRPFIHPTGLLPCVKNWEYTPALVAYDFAMGIMSDIWMRTVNVSTIVAGTTAQQHVVGFVYIG